LAVWHGQKKVGPAEVLQRVNLPGIAGVNHDFEVIGRVLDDALDVAVLLHIVDSSCSRLINVWLHLKRQVVESDRVLCRDLLAQNPRGKSLVEDVSLQFRFLLFECGDKLRQDEELIAADEDYEPCIGGIAVKIGNIVNIGDVKEVSRLRGGLFAPLLQRGITWAEETRVLPKSNSVASVAISA